MDRVKEDQLGSGADRAGMRRFACTACGKCCNRSPEVELSEAAGLADIFVFRLMFRLYRQPRMPERGDHDRAHSFFERKRLLTAHAARAYRVKAAKGGKTAEFINYLMVSALALDAGRGACSALGSSRCTIYQRRPLTCRTVPFHYSRGEASAEQDFDAFVSTPGYCCDISEAAPIVFESGSIVEPQTQNARAQALAIARRDLGWKRAIVRHMRPTNAYGLPTLGDVETNAQLGALTTSMCAAWQIAAAAGLIEQCDVKGLLTAQLATIDSELAKGMASPESAQTLREMRAEYVQSLAS